MIIFVDIALGTLVVLGILMAATTTALVALMLSDELKARKARREAAAIFDHHTEDTLRMIRDGQQ